jgi:ACS family hexuronate transporter-like MFS transporter
MVYGWRSAFVVTGASGLLWLVAWLWIHPREVRAVKVPGVAQEGVLWGTLLRDRTLWLLVLSRAIADPVWYFYLFWFPKYLNDVRGMKLAAVASVAWVVYLAADLGSIGGGAISSWLVKRGIEPARSRLMAMAGAALIAPVGLFSAFHPQLPLLFAIGSAVAFAHLVYQINISTLVVDLYPGRNIATIFGIIGAGSALGGMLSAQVVGSLVSSGNFDRSFVLMAFLHPLAFGVAWLAVKLAPRSRLIADTVPLPQDTSSA